MEGTPAETAGLRQDDVIVGIDGSTIEGLSQEDVVSQLRGRPGSEVRLSIDREEAAAPLVLTVERSHTVPQTGSFHREGNLAYRSEGRRVGKECVSRCKSRWERYN